eukprot:CAMPEP_0201592518 /NCGR_PEP_ID=MMETSP0190_2-20130828/190391_1 /ASSEMBLY_ACC=CAM_ASM_000263 /TAXON_ID=37353 /ORGANISM="Rosalina sp." /LENGTH=460 /DNA_ID=CAMNT_0048051329 /DNA_START=836 /DNA_END=2213 /DNA_ORIENTATION=-
MDGYLYVIGGIYDPQDTRFIEQWQIDIDTDYNPPEDKQTSFDNFTNINTLINIDVASQYLPEYGHRCVVNDVKKPSQLYVIGGITRHDGDDYTYSKYMLVLQRENDTLKELNYMETEEEEIKNPNEITAKILPSLPTPLAYTAAMVDQYGYLNLFGGQLHPEKNSDHWYRINTKFDKSSFDNFTNINTLINIDVASQYLPEYGHRCVVNDVKKPAQLYVIGGITRHDGDDYTYSKYMLVLQRENQTLMELNYMETEEEEIKNPNEITAKILPSLPTPLAYTAAMVDQYGYLNLFGGQLHPEKNSDHWYRINTKFDTLHDIDINNNNEEDVIWRNRRRHNHNEQWALLILLIMIVLRINTKFDTIHDIDITNNNEEDVIWRNRRRHNHNEQWALLILLIMIVLVAFWFKCVAKITKLRNNNNNRSGGRGLDTDGTAYDEITGTDDIDELEDDIDDDNLLHG